MAGTNIYGELIKAQMQNSASDLTTPATGMFYWNTGTSFPKWYTGALWKTAVDTDSTQTFTNKSLTAAKVTDFLDMSEQGSSPATPASGYTRFYSKSDNKLYQKDDSGVESLVGGGSGSGSGEINIITNPSAATDLTGITDGTSHTTTRVTSGSPLDPVTTTAFSVAATTTAVESSTSGARFSPTMPTGLRNKKLKVDIYFTTEASQTWAVSVYANGTRLALSTDSSGATTLPAGTTGKYTTYFDSNSESAYTVNVTRTAGSGTATLIMTSVIVGPGIQPQGAVVGDEDVSGITFVGFGTVAATTLKGYRRGNMLVVQGAFQGGTVAADNMRVVLPSHLVIDETKYQSTRASVVGQFSAYRIGATQYPFSDPNTAVMFYDGANGESVYITNSSASDNMQKVTGLAVYGNNQYFSFEFEVPVAAWAGSGTVNLAQNDVEYCYNTTVTDADDTTAFGYGPGGGQFPAVATTSKTKRVRFQTPIVASDTITLETSFDSGRTWGEVGQHEEDSAGRYQIQNTLTYGMQVVHINATDVDVRFGIHRTVNPSVGYGAAGSAWSDIDANPVYLWRVKKVKGGQAVGFGIVDPGISSGLVSASGLPGNDTGNSIAAGYVGEVIDGTGTFTGTPSNTALVTVTLTTGVWLINANAYTDDGNADVSWQWVIKGTAGSTDAKDRGYSGGAPTRRYCWDWSTRVVVVASGDATKTVISRVVGGANTSYYGYAIAVRIA